MILLKIQFFMGTNDIVNACVGKSCLLLQFSNGSFATSFVTTRIGRIDCKVRTIDHVGKHIKLQIWDTTN